MTDDGPADIYDYLKLLERAPETFRRSWDAIAIYDLEGRVMLGNAVARAMVGPDRAETLRGRHFTEHMTLAAATKAARDFAHCVTHGETVEGNSEFVGDDGSAIPVRMRLVPARAGDRIVGVIGFARDGRHRQDILGQFMRSEQQFRSLFENHPDGLALHDLESRFLRVNDAAVRLTGYTLEEMVGQTPEMFGPPGTYDAEAVRAAMLRGEVTEFEHPVFTKSGIEREINGRRVPLFFDGEVRGFCSMIHDVTEERRAARNSARQATRIAELYRIAAAASVAQDERVETALEAGLAELGAEWAYVARAGEAGSEIMWTAGERPANRPEEAFATEDLSVEGRRYGTLAFVQTKRPMQISATDRDYVRALAVLIGSAIQQGERTKRLDSLAFTDALTGLPNRALLEDRLEQTLLSARRHRRSFAAHYIDVDHFKEINDTYGHHIGDSVLIAVSSWLRAALRDSDTIARIGGDEFVVLQPEIDSQRQAEELAAKLCTIRDQTMSAGARGVSVTISVGCAVFPVDADSPVDMLKAADAALYEVKHRGRDGYAVGVAN